jgi:histidine decarboxylase
LNHRGNQHAVPASLKGKYVIRFTITSTHTTSDDIIKDWNEIRSVANDILEECNAKIEKRVPLKGNDT